MKSKKTSKANLERLKPSMLLIGLVLSMALVLESFEWMGTDYKGLEIASALDTELPDFEVKEVELFRPQKKKTTQPKKTSKEFVKILKKDEVITEKPIEEKKEELPDLDKSDFIDDDDDDDNGGGYIEVIDSIFVIVEEMPEYPGGIKAMYEYLGKNLKYPSISAEAGSQGQALINFTVEKNGKISDVKSVGGSADKYCQKEAERIVEQMPKWKAGKQRGKKVRVSFTLPIRFRLN